MHRPSIRAALAASVFLGPTASSAFAQQVDSIAQRIVTTEATGEVSMPPDHARLTFGVTTLRPTAPEAAAEIATVLTQIRDSLVAVGVPRDSVPTMGYTIRRQLTRDADTLAGYHGETSVVVTIWNFTRIGPVIEAVIGAGANDVSGIQFRASDQRPARDGAIGVAVAAARRDAEALAEAAGHRLGSLLELSTVTNPFGRAPSGVFYQQARAREYAIRIVPRDIVVRVSVTARWRLEPGAND
jgi:uncharacterized protein YggE